jgi:hypothetical protein
MRRGPTIGAGLAVAAAVLFLALQPIRESWWHWADPDGAYAGSSLNILFGNHTHYLDHPGLPTQDALAIAFGAEYLVGKATGAFDTRQAFVEDRMLDLDQSRVVYRLWAALLFVGAALLVYVAVWRLLGHWTWGLAGSLVFLGAPGLGAISFLLRPDAAVAALCLAVGYLSVTAFERRSAWRYAGAAALLGLAMTVKLTAIAMVVPLAVAALWRAPGPDWAAGFTRAGAAWLRRHALWLAPVLLAWIVLCIVFNRERLPVLQTDEQRGILLTGATVLLGYAGLAVVAERFDIPWANRLFRTFYASLGLAFVAGLALPATLVLDDGVQMLVSIKETLTGGRVNEGIEPFENFTWSAVRRYPLNVGFVVIGLGVLAGGVALVRRRYWPFLLALGSLVLATMAAARYSYDYYYAPAFAVAIPGVLWLLGRARSGTMPIYLWIPVLALFGWTVTHVQTWEQRQERAVDDAAQELADELLAPGEVMMTLDYYFPVEDVRFDSLVDGFVDHVPAYPYRFVHRPEVAAERGLVPRFLVARGGDLPPPGDVTNVDIAGSGPFVVETLARRWGPGDEFGVARILESPPLQP